MKKWLKVLLISFVVIILIISSVLYYSISFIDTAPYFSTVYYKNTISKLNTDITNREISQGQLFAGFSKINITPNNKEVFNNTTDSTKQIRLAGYGDGQIAKGVHDSIYVKAIALKVNDELQILVSADLLLIPPTVVESIENKLVSSGIKRKQIIFGATHTHSSMGNTIPNYVGEQFGGKYYPEVVEWLSKKFVTVIDNSVKDLKESSFSSGKKNVPELIVNRLYRKKGRLNDRLTVLSIKQQNAKHAVIGIYGAHATIIGGWNNQFSGDYPGRFQHYLEEDKQVDMAMFFAGSVGSHSNSGKGEKFDRTNYVGRTLADSVLALINHFEYECNVTFSSVSTEIETPKTQAFYISENRRLSPEVASYLFPPIRKTCLQSFIIDNFIWNSMPCEISGEFTIDFQNALELKGINSAVTSFNGQYLGYVVPGRYYNYDSYESRLMGWFGPSMGDYLMELNYTLADSLTGIKL